MPFMNGVDFTIQSVDALVSRRAQESCPELDKRGNILGRLIRDIISKSCPKECVFNALFLPGSLSTLNNNLFAFYDFLVAHSKQEIDSPARFFIFGYYEMSIESESKPSAVYKPSSFEACGEVLKRTLDTLQEQFGKFNLISAHSAGCINLAALLKRSGPELLPTMLHLTEDLLQFMKQAAIIGLEDCSTQSQNLAE